MKLRSNIERLAGIMVLFLLVGGLAFQIFGISQYLEKQFNNKTLANQKLNAFLRSGDASFGSEFASYLQFLRDQIPEDASVVIPPDQGSQYFLNDLYLMQYFLFPRRIITCQQKCDDQLLIPNTFFISQDKFPSPDTIPNSYRFEPFNETLGLYVPEAK